MWEIPGYLYLSLLCRCRSLFRWPIVCPLMLSGRKTHFSQVMHVLMKNRNCTRRRPVEFILIISLYHLPRLHYRVSRLISESEFSDLKRREFSGEIPMRIDIFVIQHLERINDKIKKRFRKGRFTTERRPQIQSPG